jgi:hypothetical protein
MFEGLSEHGNNSTDYAETARSPSFPKLTPLTKCESLQRRDPQINLGAKYKKDLDSASSAE